MVINTMDDILENIKTLVSEKSGVDEKKLNRSTRLYEDLKIDGDDAFELLEAFTEKFSVDMSGFKYNEYFAPEGIDLIGAVSRLFKGKEKKKLKPLTLADLEQAAKEGKWTD